MGGGAGGYGRAGADDWLAVKGAPLKSSIKGAFKNCKWALRAGCYPLAYVDRRELPVSVSFLFILAEVVESGQQTGKMCL